jgi:hypothetical protein
MASVQEFTLLLYYLFIWISWVLYRTFSFPNKPTLEEISAKFQGEDKDVLKKRNHRQRLITALIYVPSVPFAAVISPTIFIIFLLTMNTLALQEFLSIVTVMTDEEKRKVKLNLASKLTSKRKKRRG